MDIINAITKSNFVLLTRFRSEGGDFKLIKDMNGMTPVMLAVDNGQIEVLKYMIKEKVDLDAKDKWGQTALMLAAGRNDVQSITLLINAKANLNIIAKNGLSALGYAIENNNGEAAKVLKQAGAK